MSDLLPIRIRDATVDDEGFVIQTWLKSYRKGSDFARKIHPKLYFIFHHPVVEAIWQHPATKKLIACDPEAESVIYGYLVYTKHPRDFFDRWKIEARPVVHYVYTKEAFQHMRVCSRLFEASKLDPTRLYITHLTRDKVDTNQESPRYGDLRWRGSETLLAKYPLAREEIEKDPQTKKKSWTYYDGNLYLPYLI